jgi:tubulin--tyrosine ligase
LAVIVLVRGPRFFLHMLTRSLLRFLLAAFALSSGTVGAALSSSLSKVRSIAISYGIVLYPTPTTLFEPAHVLGGHIIRHLWENWGKDEGGLRDGEVDLYNVNIPMVERLLEDDGMTVHWTHMWRNSYGRLYKSVPSSHKGKMTSFTPSGVDSSGSDSSLSEIPSNENLMFKFSPDMSLLLNPPSVPTGSDGWAVYNGMASVTPLRASLAEPVTDFSNPVLKLKL